MKIVWIAAKLFGCTKTAPLSFRGLCPWQNDDSVSLAQNSKRRHCFGVLAKPALLQSSL
jgi:hypothetical protein